MSLNQILLIGNAGRDAELRYTPSGAQVASFSMAVNRNYQVNGEWREETEWFNVSAWGRQAENVAQRVRRGAKVFVDGRLSTRRYTTESGETRTSLDVNAYRVINLSGQQEEDGQSYGSYGEGSGLQQQPPASQWTGSGSSGSTANEDAPGDIEDLPW